jgi:two-component sensor histidine kinase
VYALRAGREEKPAQMTSPEQKKSAMPGTAETPAAAAASEFFPDLAALRAVLEAAQIGIWRWDMAADKVTWSSNLEAIHRLAAGGFDGTGVGFARSVNPEDWPRIEAAVRKARRETQPVPARYRLSQGAGSDDRWLELGGIVAVKDGAAERLFGLCRDITERVKLEAELRGQVKQQEALAQLAERALAEPDLEKLFNDAVSTVARTLAVDLVSVLELLPGDAELLLRAGCGWKGGLVGSVIAATDPESCTRYTLQSPLPVITADFATESRFHTDPYLQQHGCVSGVNVAIAGPDERHYGILGVGTKTRRQFAVQEIAFLAAVANLLAGAIARRQLEQRHEFMIRDMRHRSGNLFSQLLALFSQTARSSRSINDLATKYRARVLALADAQRLITESGGRSIPFMDLLYVLLGPYVDRISLSGPNVELQPDPVFNLSAALHELADNAVKHGSLSRPAGRLDLSWSVSHTQRGATLVLDWSEKNGPPARRPRRSGFGSRLIALVIERQLNGEVTRSFTRGGLCVHLVVPLTHDRWPTAVAAGR